MPAFNPRIFSNPDRLKQIAPFRLKAFLEPWKDYFKSRELDVAAWSPDDMPLEEIAKVLMSPDAKVPDEMVDALYYVHETASHEAMDELLDRAAAAGIEIDTDHQVSVADVAVQIWLAQPILLSFAQFEREVTAERIRDKFAASRKKGIWMGGVPPLGYRVEKRKLVIDGERAERVRWIFTRFLEIGSTTELAREALARGIRNRNGNRMDKKYIYRLLGNRAYIGEAVHKGKSYPGEHDAIIDRETWDRVHAILTESPRTRAANTRTETPALLKGLLYGPDGAAFSPSHTRKGDRLYRYYVSQSVLKHGAGSCPIGRVPAGEIEAAVIDQLRAVFRQPEIVAGTWKAARAQDGDITEADAREALQQFDLLWDELFPAEQARIVALLVERVDIGENGLRVRLRVDGLTDLAREMLAGGLGAAA